MVRTVNYRISEDGSVVGLTKHHKVLVELKEFLYEGDWDEIVKDLLERRNSPPKNVQLYQKIDADVTLIEHLRKEEKRLGLQWKISDDRTPHVLLKL